METVTLCADNKPYLTLRPPSDIPKQTNCPNCCAPINGKRCEYCGTWFIKPEEIEKEKGMPDTLLHYELGRQIGDLKTQISKAQMDLASSMQTAAILSAYDIRQSVIQATNCNAVESLRNSLGPSFVQIDIPTEEVIKESWLQKFIHKLIGG